MQRQQFDWMCVKCTESKHTLEKFARNEPGVVLNSCIETHTTRPLSCKCYDVGARSCVCICTVESAAESPQVISGPGVRTTAPVLESPLLRIQLSQVFSSPAVKVGDSAFLFTFVVMLSGSAIRPLLEHVLPTT